MSTRAVYTFKDERETVHVYKHHDGYPEGGISWIANARNYAWCLPRFEASDFAAAFVAANKERYDPSADYPTAGGGVRLCSASQPGNVAADAEYHYVVTTVNGDLHVKVNAVNWWDEPTSETIFSGSLAEAIAKFEPTWLETLDNKPA